MSRSESTSRTASVGRWFRGVCAGALAAVTVATAAPAAAADVILDTDAKPVLDWSVPSRFTASWSAWNAGTASYNPSFVTPPFWSLNLNGCASTSVRAITAYAFTVTQVGTTWKRTYTTTSCRLSLPNQLPALGYYKLSLTLHTDYGIADGVSLPTTRTAQLRDHLIVSMGDSLASGEGNPDLPGSYSVGWQDDMTPIGLVELRRVQWQDRRCHRSAKSGPALAAKAFEDADSKTSVTFLSVACSGAELQHLINTSYGGIEPDGVIAAPQIDAVAAVAGPGAPGGGRTIDALLISAGINDLDFSDILNRCYRNNNLSIDHENCVTSGGIAQQVEDLPSSYSALASALRAKLPSVREVYLNDYPSDVFHRGACGFLAPKGTTWVFGIDTAEGSEMQTWGIRLSNAITDAMRRHRSDADRWNTVGSMTTAFLGHNYCDSASWFTSWERSWATQGNQDGTAHPNATGHMAYGNILRKAIVLDQGRQAYRQLTVRIEALKAAPLAGAAPQNVDMTLWEFQNDLRGLTRYVSVPRNGSWTTVPAELGTFTIPMFVAPASPRHATELRMVIGRILPIHHIRSEGYGAGQHELIHPTGSLAVRYSVVSTTPAPGGGVIG